MSCQSTNTMSNRSHGILGAITLRPYMYAL